MAIGFNSIGASDSWCRCRKRNYAVSIKRLFDAVERRGDIGRRVAALVLPISNRPRVTSGCAGKIGLREPGEHTSGPNLASRDNVAHKQYLYTILETLLPVIPLCRKQVRTTLSDGHMLAPTPLSRCCATPRSTGRQKFRLQEMETVSLGHGVSLLRWRSGGSNTGTIRRLIPSCRHRT